MSSHSNPSDPDLSIIVWVDDDAYEGLPGHTIGRDPRDSITIDHPHVSRHHAMLEYGDGRWAVTDDKSMNGLYDRTNGTRMPSVPLAPGSTEVWFGPPHSSPSVRFEVSAPPGPGPSSDPPPYNSPRPGPDHRPASRPPPPPPGPGGYTPPQYLPGPGGSPGPAF